MLPTDTASDRELRWQVANMEILSAFNRADFGAACFAEPLREPGWRKHPTSVPSRTCGGVALDDVPALSRTMRWRGSWWWWKRRQAYAACLQMIRLREAALGIA